MIKVIKRYKRIIIAVACVLLIGGIITGVVLSHKSDDKETGGVSISAGDDGKDNEADFNGQEGQGTTKPVQQVETVESNFDTVIEKKGSIIGEWVSSEGDKFNCSQSDDGLFGAFELAGDNSYISGTIETDNSTYIKLTSQEDNSVKDIQIVKMADASELGVTGDQVYIVLKLPGFEDETLFRRANEDYINETIKEILKEEGDGISGGEDSENAEYVDQAEEVSIIDEEEPSEQSEEQVPEEPVPEEPVE